MSTTTTKPATITIDRHERDVLRYLLDLRLSGDGIELGDPESAKKRRQEFEDAFPVLDQIGWKEDDSRETFELAVDEPLRRVLEREQDGMSHHVAYEALLCKRVGERDEGILKPGASEDAWKEWEGSTSRSLERALDELHVLERISHRVWWKDHGEDRD